MSRTLSRLREATGDPLLVRAGRALVPTPRAVELRESVGRLVRDAEAVLRPVGDLDLARLERTFTLRASDGFLEAFGAGLVARVGREAPGVRLRFLQKLDKDSAPLRDGRVDMDTGVVADRTGPELRAQALFRDRLVGAVRRGHALVDQELTPARFAAARHVAVSRTGVDGGLIDEALASLGLARRILVSVDGFAKALALARASDLVATVPERQTRALSGGMLTFELPFAAPEVTVSLLWHPRMDADPAHRWLRTCVREVCADPESG
jgi:DNA-binding transcriptional LysR family regulator